MNEPKVTIYRIVIAQVCLFRKISNCLAIPSFIVPKAATFSTSSMLMMMKGMAAHMFSTPRPVGGGRYR